MDPNERTIWLPEDDAPELPPKVVCPACHRQTYEGEHSPEECRVYQRKLQELRAGTHPAHPHLGPQSKAWLPPGWNDDA